MTDRHAGYIVVLADDVREDDAEHVIAALKMIKGVIRVQPIVSSVELMIAKSRADGEWRQRIVDLLQDS